MRLALGIEYDGTDFFGWQKLGHGPSVQAVVESALGFVADAPVVVQCAGRTDSGVHARCQVVHFDTDAQRPTRGWVLGANSRLPDSVAVRWAQSVAQDFNARYAARARRYRYRILDRNIRPVGKAYKQLIADWAMVLPTQSVCMVVPLVRPSEYNDPWARRRRDEAAAMRRAQSATRAQDSTGSEAGGA